MTDHSRTAWELIDGFRSSDGGVIANGGRPRTTSPSGEPCFSRFDVGRVVGDAIEQVGQALDAGQVAAQAGREFTDPSSPLKVFNRVSVAGRSAGT